MKKILIANRGEIAVRVIRACRDMGLSSVAVYSDLRSGGAARPDGGRGLPGRSEPPRESYLRIDRMIDVARASGADAVHPGYGFLAENEELRRRPAAMPGLTFIGPSPEAITLMGSKTAARQVAIAAGVPVVPGTETPLARRGSTTRSSAMRTGIGYPLMLKAVAGGGGKGMRTVSTAGDAAPARCGPRGPRPLAFGDSAVYLERRIAGPRHIEVQLLGDHHGTVVPFVERECSIQRRHQKVVEESPSPAVDAGPAAAA